MAHLFVSRLLASTICPEGDVVIESQADLDSLIIEYANCTVVAGNLEVKAFQTSGLEEFLGLIDTVKGNLRISNVRDSVISNNSIVYIGGDLTFDGIFWLKKLNFTKLKKVNRDLNILNNYNLSEVRLSVSEITGCLYVYRNFNLINLEFYNLETVIHSLVLRYNEDLTQASFQSIQTAGDLIIDNNDKLVSLNIPKISKIVGSLEVKSNDKIVEIGFDQVSQLTEVNIFLNASLQKISLRKLESVDVSVYIALQKSLKRINLKKLVSLGGSLILTENDSLSDIGKLDQIFSIGQYLYVFDNPFLSVCNSLCPLLKKGVVGKGIYLYRNGMGCGSRLEVERNCEEVGYSYPFDTTVCPENDVVISTQEELDTFSSRYPNCTELINKSLSVDGETITDLKSISSIKKVDDYFVINRTTVPSLKLDSIKYIGKYAYVRFNRSVDTIEFQNLDSIGGGILIEGNEKLQMLAMPNLHSTSQGFAIFHNNKLTSLNLPKISSLGTFALSNNFSINQIDLPSLTDVENSIHIANNSSITSIKADSLSHIGYSLYISGNSVLQAVSFSSLREIRNTLYVYDNSKLANCNTFCPLIALDRVGYSVQVYGNAEGCDGLVQVRNSCSEFCFDTLELSQYVLPSYHVSEILSLSAPIYQYGDYKFSAGNQVNINFPFEVKIGGKVNIEIEGCSKSN